MLEGLVRYLENRSFLELGRDALDVLLVYYLCYRALLVVRGTRAIQIALGLGLIFLLYIGARWLELISVLTITGTLIQSIILVMVVVFQNDIRRALQRVGSRAWFGSLVRAQETRVIDEVVDAATELARHRVGALIAFEQDANLDEFVGSHKGHTIDAQVTSRLLVSLFLPERLNTLHDGAVVIRNFRIAKAGVFFPMPEGRIVDESFGSRHRAALGITEETDAVVVIVSEERGSISFCFNGNIASNLDGVRLRAMLEAIFRPAVRKRGRRVTDRAPLPAQTLGPKISTPDVATEPEAGPGPLAEDLRRSDSQPPPPLRAAARPQVETPKPADGHPAPESAQPGPVKPKPLRTPIDSRASEQYRTPAELAKREAQSTPNVEHLGPGEKGTG